MEIDERRKIDERGRRIPAAMQELSDMSEENDF